MLSSNKVIENYSPLYFLNALGAGGLVVTFYMYLMWMTPHQGSPIPSYESLIAALVESSLLVRSIVIIGALGVIIFSVMHFQLLVQNIKNYNAWKTTTAYNSLRKSNAETQLLVLPLTFAMTVNVIFILGVIFVPGLWEAREFLFPLSLVVFSIIGFYALRTYLDFFGRVLTEGGFDCSRNNSLGQMISVFAFSMIGVGFSAIAAMSHNKIILLLGFLGSLFFVTAAILMGLIKLVLGFRAMMEHKAEAETTPTLWIIIPIMTVLGIAIYRLKMSLMHNFDVKITPAEIMAFLVVLFSIQLFFGLIGWVVMKRVKYRERWIDGKELSPGAYALVCPGVGLFVLANFVINAGLVKTGILEPMSAAYFVLYIPLVYLQIITINLLLKLNRKLLRS